MPRFPFRVTLLLWLVLIHTAVNILRLWTGLAWSDVLSEFESVPGPAVVVLFSVVFVLLGIALIWGLWQAKAWTKYLLIGTAAGSTAWFWSERFVHPEAHLNSFFAVIVNLIVLIFILFASRSLTREAYERKS
jgi:hypothetical protein